MSTIIRDVFKALSGIDLKPSISENKELCEMKASYENPGTVDKTALENALGKISERDNYVLNILKDDSEICSSRDGINQLINILASPLHKGRIVEAKLRINKKLPDFVLSVYEYKAFTDYLTGLPVKSFFYVISSIVEHGYVTLECFDDEMSSWRTNSIMLKKYSDDIQLMPPNTKAKADLTETRKEMCHWDKNIEHIIPDDFFILQGKKDNDALQKTFKICSVVLMLMFLFDYSTLERERLRFKLSGYKTISGEIDTQGTESLNYMTDFFNDIRNIYEWCYYCSLHDEKIAIARNILSLNATFPKLRNQTFNINHDTYDTIKSNYKFYEKEHIRQYVEVHGKLMDTILALQSKVVTAVDGFIKEFKTGFYVTMSFMTSSVVVRSVNNDSFLSKPLLIISGVIILIYFATYFYYSYELEGKIKLMKIQYDKIRKRYGTLLSQTEKTEIFGEDNSYGETIAFAEKQLNIYTRYWIGISVILLLLDGGAYFLI